MSKKQKLPPRRAAALHYSGTGAPKMVAKGEGDVAAAIESTARAHGVPLVHDPVLTNVLSRVPLGDEIPEFLFTAVAEVLAHIYKVSEVFDSSE